MLGEISAGFASLKAALDIAQGLNAANTQALINEIKIDLQGHILEAQRALSSAQETQSTQTARIRNLEQEIMELKDWEGEKQRYHLKNIDRGAVAYVMKPGMENGEDPHWLCPNCFNRRQKSFLQYKGREHGSGREGMQSIFGCDACKSTLKVYYTRNPVTPWTPDKNSSGE